MRAERAYPKSLSLAEVYRNCFRSGWESRSEWERTQIWGQLLEGLDERLEASGYADADRIHLVAYLDSMFRPPQSSGVSE